MTLVLTEEQRMLQESARQFVERDYDSAKRRRLIASEDGFDAANWAQFAALGWLGVALSEAHDGSDGGLAEIAVNQGRADHDLGIETGTEIGWRAPTGSG